MRLLPFFAVVGTIGSVFSADWPKGYQLIEKSKSPDGCYGIMACQDQPDDETPNDVNLLVNLSRGKNLGEIQNSLWPRNHVYFSSRWANDLSYCLAEYDKRFGMWSLQLLIPDKESFRQVPLGQEVIKQCAKVYPDTELSVSVWDDGKGNLVIMATGTNDPKLLREQEGKAVHLLYFRGYFNLKESKWHDTHAEAVTKEKYEYLSLLAALHEIQDASDPRDFSAYRSADDALNLCYKALKDALPKARFEQLRSEQRVWLKETEKLTVPEEIEEAKRKRSLVLAALWWSL